MDSSTYISAFKEVPERHGAEDPFISLESVKTLVKFGQVKKHYCRNFFFAGDQYKVYCRVYAFD